MANLVPTQLTSVLIAIGPEWAPLRTIVADWLYRLVEATPFDVASLSEVRDRQTVGFALAGGFVWRAGAGTRTGRCLNRG